MQKCIICKKKAIYRYSPDLDLQGLGACKKHKGDVFMAYYFLINKGKKEYNDYLKNHKDFKE